MHSSTSSSDPGKRSLLWMLLPALALLLLLAIGNYVVNPLLLFDSPGIPQWNVHKPRYLSSLHEIKPYLLRETLPRQLILGSSRAGNGLDPAHPAFRPGEAFNYGTPGAKIQLLADLYSDAQSVSKLDTVVLTLDFFAFNAVPSDVDLRDTVMRSHLQLEKQGVRRWSGATPLLERRLEGLFSFASLTASVETVSRQERMDSSSVSRYELFRNGHWRQYLPTDFPQLQQIRQTERNYMSSIWFPLPTRRFEFSHKGLDSFAVFEALLTRIAQEVETPVLLISPLHARFQSALGLAGLDGAFEEWKRKLVAINESVAERVGSPVIPLWDFADFSEHNREPTPEVANVQARMRYYLDGQHYTVDLGNIVLNRVFSGAGDSEPGFGSLLTGSNVEDHLLELRRRQQQYAASNGDEMEDLQQSFLAIQ